MTTSDEKYRELAFHTYRDPGHVEIDSNAEVSHPDDLPELGAYVRAWVWVDNPELNDDK